MTLRKRDIDDDVALLEYKDGIKLIYIYSYKKRYYLVLAGLIVDYKEQVLIIDIKRHMQCLICYVSLIERELVIQLWESQTYQ